jgi:hypothetical protein
MDACLSHQSSNARIVMRESAASLSPFTCINKVASSDSLFKNPRQRGWLNAKRGEERMDANECFTPFLLARRNLQRGAIPRK